MKNFVLKTLKRLFPEKCISCKSEGSPICESCISKIPKLSEYDCLPEIISAYSYKNKIIHDGLWRLKFKNKRMIGYIFGEQIFYFIKNLLPKDYKILLVPIPPHQKKAKERNYNQTQIISDGVLLKSKNSNLYNLENCSDLIIRKVETEKQAKIKNKKARVKNMQGVFGLNPKYLNLNRETHIIIIDDISTTGQTLYDAKRSLEEEGFENILLVSVAH